MMTVRRSNSRGHARHGWLDSRHSFSFANYYDPRFMGISALRVINDDWVKPGYGFDTHPHRDMEIISYVLAGQIEHKDTMGFHTVLNAGDVQVMSAGTGILHSEYNPSNEDDLNFLQIWIQPDRRGVTPRYQQMNIADHQGLSLIASSDGRDGSLSLHQDASLYNLRLDHQPLQRVLQPERSYYLHLTGGTVTANGITLGAGDAIGLSAETTLSLTDTRQLDALLFELP